METYEVDSSKMLYLPIDQSAQLMASTLFCISI